MTKKLFFFSRGDELKRFFFVFTRFRRIFSHYRDNPEMLHYYYGGWLIFDALMLVLKCTFIAGRSAVGTASEIN